MSVRVRFAPSPTGYLHIGGARTALFNWLFARQKGGVFILRIEDTDAERSKPEYEAQILDAMRWLGLDWDEGPISGGDYGPYRQSDRTERYKACLEQLIESGHAYRCTCTPERLADLRAHQEANKLRIGYDGHCRERNLGPDCGDHVVRLKMPTEGEILVEDMIKGPTRFQAAQLQDWVVRRTDGGMLYNFVVVVDDHDMQVTHVIRGDDHLNNTPKQVALYKAFGWDVPEFAHLPMILGQDGRRLSKRHAATSVGEYQDGGFLPEALINYLTRLGWAHGDMEEFSTDESIPLFTLGAVNKTGAKWDMDKLTWLNAQWMKRLSPERLLPLLQPFLDSNNITADDRLSAAVDTLRPRSNTLSDLAGQLGFYFVDDDALEHDPAAVKKFLKGSRGPDLRNLLTVLQEIEDWSTENIESTVTTFMTENELKLSRIAQPVRVSLTGQRIGPGLYETLAALGKESSIRRIERGAELCEARVQG